MTLVSKVEWDKSALANLRRCDIYGLAEIADDIDVKCINSVNPKKVIDSMDRFWVSAVNEEYRAIFILNKKLNIITIVAVGLVEHFEYKDSISDTEVEKIIRLYGRY